MCAKSSSWLTKHGAEDAAWFFPLLQPAPMCASLCAVAYLARQPDVPDLIEARSTAHAARLTVSAAFAVHDGPLALRSASMHSEPEPSIRIRAPSRQAANDRWSQLLDAQSHRRQQPGNLLASCSFLACASRLKGACAVQRAAPGGRLPAQRRLEPQPVGVRACAAHRPQDLAGARAFRVQGALRLSAGTVCSSA